MMAMTVVMKVMKVVLVDMMNNEKPYIYNLTGQLNFTWTYIYRRSELCLSLNYERPGGSFEGNLSDTQFLRVLLKSLWIYVKTDICGQEIHCQFYGNSMEISKVILYKFLDNDTRIMWQFHTDPFKLCRNSISVLWKWYGSYVNESFRVFHGNSKEILKKFLGNDAEILWQFHIKSMKIL